MSGTRVVVDGLGFPESPGGAKDAPGCVTGGPARYWL